MIGIADCVTAEFADGDVIQTVRSEVLPLGLTEVAIDALREWTFEPATLDGKPVAVFYNLTFNFRLQEEPVEEAGQG